MKINNFDVLIVYSHRIATSANSASEIAPFPKGSKNESYNVVYSYFLKFCKNQNLSAAFTTSADIIGPGKCSSFWLYNKSGWEKVKKTGYSKLIFDKFSPVNTKIKDTRNLLFSSKIVKPFNSPYLFELFFDKSKTYGKLKIFSIPTVTVRGKSEMAIKKSVEELKKTIIKHQNKEDFSAEIVMKDRFGAGGRSVYKIGKNNFKCATKILKNSCKRFILQPFVKFEKGFKYKNSFFPTDIRLIFMNGKIIQTYIRIAKKGDFRCNEHRGGTLIYVPKKEIPSRIISISEEILQVLGKNNSLFSLDFLISNNQNIYLLEGNTGPGLDWNMASKVNEIEAKKLIRIIVKELAKRTIPEIESKKIYEREMPIHIPSEFPTIPAEPTFI